MTIESGSGAAATLDGTWPRETVRLRADGVDLVLSRSSEDLPSVVHWGQDLGDMDGRALAELVAAVTPALGPHSMDAPRPATVLPTHAFGWFGNPGLTGSRADGTAWSPRFSVVSSEVADDDGRGGRYVVDAVDTAAALSLRLEITMSEFGVVRMRATLTNIDRDRTWRLDGLSLTLPVPREADEILDLTGRHGRERSVQRHSFTVGSHNRESRRGRPAHDSTLLLVAGERGFDFASGRVWAMHVAWSGNTRNYAERLPDGRGVLGAGELLLPGEVTLHPRQSYTSPWVVAASGRGLDEVSRRIHSDVRARASHPSSPRPVVLNTWEAVYFDHRLDSLVELADLAAQVGVERYVLDDGWFLGRRDDTAGLGDWYVDERVWPGGLQPLIDAVHARGMQFGLWVEPEMINEDSELARAHPEWILATGDGLPPRSRNQQVLDLTHPGAWEHILDRLDDLLTTYDIGYLKWDHNRDLVDAGHWPLGEPAVHAQTLALYALMDELRSRHPGVEIESCAGGGGRIDLGIAERTQRVWVSDNIDPLERQDIQRWTGLLLPPEMLGCHVASTQSHSTGRRHSLNMRAGTAIFGHMGIEWDLRQATADELTDLRQWVALYKELRPVLHTGRTIRGTDVDGARYVHGVVSSDSETAVFSVVQLRTSDVAPHNPVRLRGLDPAARYRVTPLAPGDRLSFGQHEPSVPPWWIERALTLNGRTLETVGVELPAMLPEQLILLRADRIS